MDLPRTVLGVNSALLLELEAEAVDLGFSQRLPPEQLGPHLAPDAIHYLFPALPFNACGRRPQSVAGWTTTLDVTPVRHRYTGSPIVPFVCH